MYQNVHLARAATNRLQLAYTTLMSTNCVCLAEYSRLKLPTTLTINIPLLSEDAIKLNVVDFQRFH